MSIQVSFYKTPMTARKLPNSKGSKKQRFLIKGFDAKDSDLYSIAYKGKPLLEKPKSCFKQRRFIYLKVKTDHSDQTFFIKANLNSLLKRLNLKKQHASDYTPLIQKRIQELQKPAAVIEEKPLLAPKNEKPENVIPQEIAPVEKAVTKPKVLKFMQVKWGEGDEEKTGTIKYYSFEKKLSHEFLFVHLENDKRVKVDTSELRFYPQEGTTVYFSENGVIYEGLVDESVLSPKRTKLICYIDKDNHLTGSILRRQLTMDKQSFKKEEVDIPALNKKGRITFLTLDDFASVLENENGLDNNVSVEIDGEILAVDIAKISFPKTGNKIYSFLKGFGPATHYTDYSPEEYKKLSKGEKIVCVNEEGSLVYSSEEFLTFDAKDYLETMEVEIPASQLKGIVQYHTFEELSKKKEITVLFPDKTSQTFDPSQIKFNHNNHVTEVLYFPNDGEERYEAFTDYNIDDLEDLDPNTKITLIVNRQIIETERKNIEFLNEEEEENVEEAPQEFAVVALEPAPNLPPMKTMPVKTSDNREGVVEYRTFKDLVAQKIQTKFITKSRGEVLTKIQDMEVSKLRFFPEKGTKVLYGERGFMLTGIIDPPFEGELPLEGFSPLEIIPMINKDGFFTEIFRKDIVTPEEEFKKMKVKIINTDVTGEISYTSFDGIFNGISINKTIYVKTEANPIIGFEYKQEALIFEPQGHEFFCFRRGIGFIKVITEYTDEDLSHFSKDGLITTFYKGQPFLCKISDLSLKKESFQKSMEVNIGGKNPLKGLIYYCTFSDLLKSRLVPVFHNENKNMQYRNFNEIEFLPKEDNNITLAFDRYEQVLYTDFTKDYIKRHPNNKISVIMESKIVDILCKEIVFGDEPQDGDESE